VKSAASVVGGAAFGLTDTIVAESGKPKTVSGMLFDGIVLPLTSGVYEATLGQVARDRYLLLFSEDKCLVANSSSDHRQSRTETVSVKKTDGSEIHLAHAPHI
jgi:hypothetical protein